MTWPELKAAIAPNAEHVKIDPKLVFALCIVESNANPFAWNPEPQYRYLVNVKTLKPFRALTPDEQKSEIPPSDFPTLAGDRDQEFWAQQASWGLMQVMGAVARELGYAEPYLPKLVTPDDNLAVGCRKLASLLAWAKGDVSAALAAYNGGKLGNAPSDKPKRNQAYADKVLSVYKQA